MFIKRLRLKKLLSFNDTEVELRQLNVLIGPNAVGKSNLIEAVSLLQAAPIAPANLTRTLLQGGGIRQWLWLGGPVPSPIATVECDLSREQPDGPIAYKLEFSEDAQGFVILSEQLARAVPPAGPFEPAVYFTRQVSQGTVSGAEITYLSRSESVLSLFKSPADTTPITAVGRHFEQIRIFREFRTTGPSSQARYGISTSVPKDALMDGGDNLALVLHEMDFLGVRGRLLGDLRRFCERFEDVKTRVGAGIAQIFLKETGLIENLSAIRMSDGTLKFLCLLAVLFDPKPPPLICIEEPEVGLHPDALQLVAEALVEASETVQLIVTTHSEALVDALSGQPESVLVCERDFDNGTQFKRLDKDQLHEWLEHYTLGELWRKGEIGGGRW